MPEIKDSGKRSEFFTGAVRDIQDNKGRMDLLPVSAIIEVAKHFENGCKKIRFKKLGERHQLIAFYGFRFTSRNRISPWR